MPPPIPLCLFPAALPIGESVGSGRADGVNSVRWIFCNYIELMSERGESMKAKMLRLQNLLSGESASEACAACLREALEYFGGADLSNEQVARHEVYEELRDTVKAIFAYLDRVRAPLTDLARAQQTLIQRLLLAICGFCSALYHQYYPVGCGEMIRDFLSSDCRLFVAELGGRAGEGGEEAGEGEGEEEWEWARPCSFKTPFFSRCIEIIMRNLCSFEGRFELMRVVVIGQYLRLLYYMDDYIVKEKVERLAVSHLEALEQLFRAPSKETMREASKEALEEVVDYLAKVLRNTKGEQVRRRVQLLGVTLGMSMVRQPSIERKLVGCKIINKLSYDMLYKNNFHLSEQAYAEWLLQQGFFEAVFEDHCQTSMVKLSDDSFKLLVKRGCIDRARFARFFEALEKADMELRKAMFRLIDPFRLDYYQIEAINSLFAEPRGADFYDDEFFYFYEGVSRYATQGQLVAMMAVVEGALNRHYAAFSTYLTRRRAIECYAYVFEKLVVYKDIPERVAAYERVALQFLEDPCESKLIMFKTLFNSLTEARLSLTHQEGLAVAIVDRMRFLSRLLPAANNPLLKEDLLYLLRNLLQRYRTADDRAGFSKEDLLEAAACPEVFEEMLKALREGEVEGLLESLANLAGLGAAEFSFACFRWAFLRLNRSCLRPIKKEYVDSIATYASIQPTSKFHGLDTLTYLIFNAPREPVRRGACELLAEIATNFAADYRPEGEIYLREFLAQQYAVIVERVAAFVRTQKQQSKEQEQQQSKEQEQQQGKEESRWGALWGARGALELAEALMLSTEYFGVGPHRAHNSQVATSTVWLRVYNNCCMGEDTLKIFEKRFPSNRTLFEVISEVAQQFKMGPLDMGLEVPNLELLRHHGLTLEELKLNGQELNAVRLPQSRTPTQPLLINNELSPRAKVVFSEIFGRFAVNGYLGPRECANYVNGVTMTYCPINDSRVCDLFQRYDLDRDDKLSLEDFLRFYRDCIDDPTKLENVEKNLLNLHFRSDLLPYDAPIDCDPSLLFRHYAAAQDHRLYDLLFALSSHPLPELARQAQTLLLRLPTYAKVVDSLATALDLRGRDSFEIEYLLTALQTRLRSEEGVASALIAQGNHLSIFHYLSLLAAKQPRPPSDQNCLALCLHVLRSLLGSFSLRESPLFAPTAPTLAFELPGTEVFVSIIRESVSSSDSTLLQPALALQLTQEAVPGWVLEEPPFSRDKDTRALTCNFLHLWLLSDKAPLNLFRVPVSPTNNEEWFALLAFQLRRSPSLDFRAIFRDQLAALSAQAETLEGLRYNPLICGTLKLIKEIRHQLTPQEHQQLTDCLSALLPSLLSNQNRELAYELRSADPELLLGDLERTVGVSVCREGQARNRFVGIRNLGCICYMNSILQQFFMVRQFYRLVLSLQARQEESEVEGVRLVDDFLAQLQRMYVSLEWSQKQYYDPTPFCLAVKDTQGRPIKTHIQEDAHEFLNTAFDKMEGYAKQQEKLRELEQLFGGKTVTEIICGSCKNKVEVLEHFYHLSVEVKGMKTLRESLDKFIQPEEISDYFCEGCGCKVDKITKQILVKEAPEILIVNLQRIIFDLETFLKVKVHTRLQFDHALDLRAYSSATAHPAPYALKGVVIHAGTSEGGHYYSLIKHQRQWYKFNDQLVSAFSEADIAREAFGGDDVTDHWGEHTSSTNAYILFYERVREEEQEAPSPTTEACAALIQQVRDENCQFAAQLQYHQPSFFAALHSLLLAFTHSHDTPALTRIAAIYARVLAHLAVNSDLKTQLITQVRDDILALADLLEATAVSVLQDYEEARYREIITNCNDVNIRDIYAKVLAKALKVGLGCSDAVQVDRAKGILEGLLGWVKEEAFLKNLYKSYQYFELIKDLAVGSQAVREAALESGYLAVYLDLLMGSDSILSPKPKGRPEIHSSEAIPIVELITFLLSARLASPPLTPDEKRIFNEPAFYRKVMKNKLDVGLLGPIIAWMSAGNEGYSRMIAEVLLRAMNSYEQVQDKSVVFANMRRFLLVEDELSGERLKWVYGVPQLESISYQRPEFGLMTSSESLVYSFVSSLFYLKDEKYQPFLFTLFEKRKYFNAFSAYGALSLLELVNESPRVLDYLLALPSPIYVKRSYFGWLEQYALRVKKEEHFGLPMDKNILHERLSTLTDALKYKLLAHPLYPQLPVNKYIIGKNVKLALEETYSAPGIKIDLFSHLTYVLENRPDPTGNLSLPDDEYSFASSKDSLTAKYFLKCSELDFNEEVEIEKRLTMLTFEVHTSASFCLSFKIPAFSHRIHLRAGTHSINAPYHPGPLSALLDIEQQAVLEPPPEKKEERMVVEQLPMMATQLNAPAAPSNDYFLEIECKACTYFNIGRERCEMCDSDLLS